MRIDDLVFAVILFPASAIGVRRARLWRLRESLATRLRPDLQYLLTRRRFGVLALE